MIEVTYQDKGGITHTKVYTPAQYAAWLGGCLERIGRIYPHTAKTNTEQAPRFH